MRFQTTNYQKGTGTGKKHPGPFLLFLFLVLFAPGLSATEIPVSIPGDTDEVAQQEYDINDPRNPDCPCHQWQKQADEEYQRMQQQQSNPVVQHQTNDANNDAAKSSDQKSDNSNDHADNPDEQSGRQQSSQSANSSGGGSNSHVKRGVDMPDIAVGKKTKKILRRMGRKRNGTKKWRRSMVDCFHF